MNEISRKLRKNTLYLSYLCQDGNLQSAFSCMDVVWVLYDRIMNWSIEKATATERDYFIISKGQATLSIFPILIEKGMFQLSDFENIGQLHSRFSIQTDVLKFPEGGVENSAGSLGHGMPFAAGIAMANKIKSLPSRTYVLTGDGEFCEGTMWESCIFAAAKRLDNFTVIIDDNNSVGAMVDIGDMHLKLTSFGFEVFRVDGHDLPLLEQTFRKTMTKNGKPKAVIARTVRGYGSKTLMNHDIWFHKAPNKEELSALQREVEEF